MSALGVEPNHPAVRLREHLALARRAGASFESAWPEAITPVLMAVARVHRGQWKVAFSETMSEWRAAYYREPTDTAAALVELGEADDI